MAFDFEPSIILETAPQLLGGMKLTLIITLGGLLVGLGDKIARDGPDRS